MLPRALPLYGYRLREHIHSRLQMIRSQVGIAHRYTNIPMPHEFGHGPKIYALHQ